MKSFKIPHQTGIINKSVRFPEDLVLQIEKEIEGKCSFSAFVVAAARAALESLEEEKQSQD